MRLKRKTKNVKNTTQEKHTNDFYDFVTLNKQIVIYDHIEVKIL